MTVSSETSRRSVLKTGAVGAGALASMFGIYGATESSADAAPVAPTGSQHDAYFLRLDGVAGESTNDRHKGEIDALGFQWGLTNTVRIAGTGAGAGKAQFADITFLARSSIASPKLFLAAATGRVIQTGVLTVVRKRTAQVLLTVSLKEVFVTSFQQASDTVGGDPLDQFSLAFADIKLTDFPTGGGASVSAEWDVSRNRSV